ncbi:hypothetical protein GCK32_006129 [Trichostrongylus colubriformis]|uniref:Secreted protein n=1 Tax=Trichostrongylus colubriformis TaxID=6319 RepID=A0AAN8FB45_TRICO
MLRRSVSVVILLLLFLVANSLRSIDWCQYFRLLKRDHMRPECNGIYRLQLTAQRDHPSGSLPPLHQDYLPSFRRFVDQRASITEMTKKALGLRKNFATFQFVIQKLGNGASLGRGEGDLPKVNVEFLEIKWIHTTSARANEQSPTMYQQQQPYQQHLWKLMIRNGKYKSPSS